MATTPSEIIAAIDAAILKWADEPLTIAVAGRNIQYRTLQQLRDARDYYAKLQKATSTTRPFFFQKLKAGGPR